MTDGDKLMSSVTNQYKIKSICRGSWINELGEYTVVTEEGSATVIKDQNNVVVFNTNVEDPASAVQQFLAFKYPFSSRPRLYQGKVVKFFELGDSTDYTFTIVATPDDSTVVIKGEERESYTADKGTTIEWSVSKEGYRSQSGTYTLNSSHTENVTLVNLVPYYAWTKDDLTLYTLSATPETTDKLYTFADNTMTESSTYSIVSYADSVLTVNDGTNDVALDRDSESDKSL